ncbi:Hypothetical protein A7982_00079 [Minicystis rosea]|nr:Hypothetical protein A7982_00079 [Minicystis rosea]
MEPSGEPRAPGLPSLTTSGRLSLRVVEMHGAHQRISASSSRTQATTRRPRGTAERWDIDVPTSPFRRDTHVPSRPPARGAPARRLVARALP